MLVKEFGSEGGEEARRYAPPRLIGVRMTPAMAAGIARKPWSLTDLLKAAQGAAAEVVAAGA